MCAASSLFIVSEAAMQTISEKMNCDVAVRSLAIIFL